MTQKQFNVFNVSSTWDQSFQIPTIYFDQLWNVALNKNSKNGKFQSQPGMDRFILVSGVVDAIELLPLAITQIVASDRLFAPFVGLLMANLFIFRHMFRLEFRPRGRKDTRDYSSDSITLKHRKANLRKTVSELHDLYFGPSKEDDPKRKDAQKNKEATLINILVAMKDNRDKKVLADIIQAFQNDDASEQTSTDRDLFIQKLANIRLFQVVLDTLRDSPWDQIQLQLKQLDKTELKLFIPELKTNLTTKYTNTPPDSTSEKQMTAVLQIHESFDFLDQPQQLKLNKAIRVIRSKSTPT